MIGQTLNHYRVLEKLGVGGMGEVYLAEDSSLKRRVALKIVPPDLASSQERLERFQREAESLAALNHPNIVTIYSVESAGDIRFLTMELVEGKSLEQLIPKDGMELGGFFDVAIPLAEALSAAHEKGITHRDLKPANVMVSDEGRVKVLDFGLAKLLETGPASVATELPTQALTQEGMAVGTVPYMSPEQIEGKAVDHRTDIFSLGILLYEMATGERPFSGDSSPALMSSILKDQPAPATELRAELPRHLGRILEQCLEKDPRDRIQTARDVYNQLRSLRREVESGSVATGSHITMQSEAPSAAPPPKVDTEQRVFGVPVWLIITLAGMAFGLATMWITMRRPSEQPAETAAVSEETAGPAASSATRNDLAADSRKMIVVLPFDNLGPPEQEYFADGMAEEITSRLAAVGELGVISRSSAMPYKVNRPSVQQIGDELRVGYVLEGTVRWAGGAEGSERVRITTQLIEVEDGTLLWAENYDRVLDDIFQVQSEIAGEVIDQLGVTLLEPERQAMTARPTENLEAYQAYLRGSDLLDNLDDASLEEALAMFRRAVELDPSFASAWVRLTMASAVRYHFGYDRSESLKEESRAAAERALELNPESSEAHTAMGFFHYHVNKDYEPAMIAFDQAIEIQPDNANALEGKALVLRRISRFDESIELMDQALKYNPRDVGLVFNQGDSLMFVRDYDRADALFEKAIEIQSDFIYAYFYRAMNFVLQSGDVDSARAMLESMPETEAPDPYWMWWLLETMEGDTEAALAMADRFEMETFPLGAKVQAPSLMRGLTYLYAGEPELAKPHLEEAKLILERNIETRQDAFRYRSALGRTLAALGDSDEGIRQAEQAEREYPISKDSAWGSQVAMDLAHTYVMVRDEKKAIAVLDRLLSIPSEFSVSWIELDPRWDALRENPDFQAVLEKHR